MLFFLFLLFFVAACNQIAKENDNAFKKKIMAENFQLIDSLKQLAKSGDIIFRNGTDEVSKAARSMNRTDTSFSHCGFIFKENDSFFVYHAIGGIYNPDQKLKRELLDSFCNPTENDKVGIYRYHLSVDQMFKLDTIVKGYYHAGLKFDLFFNYLSDDKMYCSEFVFKSLNQSTKGLLTKYMQTDNPTFWITTDDIFLNKNCLLIKRQDFRK